MKGGCSDAENDLVIRYLVDRAYSPPAYTNAAQ